VKTVPCPRCGTQAPYSPENRWRPFCSERCRTIDLGAWASESFRIPVAEPDEEKIADGGPGKA
jgi:endogenous inhibitor of DNA gyrase (YacG/DUF329 family)